MEDQEFLQALRSYIENAELVIEHATGDGRDLGELIADGDMPHIYAEVINRLVDLNAPRV